MQESSIGTGKVAVLIVHKITFPIDQETFPVEAEKVQDGSEMFQDEAEHFPVQVKMFHVEPDLLTVEAEKVPGSFQFAARSPEVRSLLKISLHSVRFALNH